MVATAIYSVTMVLWKETAFPLCRSMERRWKRNVVSRVSSVIVVIANLLCELNGHLMPCTSCFSGKWVEDVCAGQFGVFVYLVLRCLVGCCIPGLVVVLPILLLLLLLIVSRRLLCFFVTEILPCRPSQTSILDSRCIWSYTAEVCTTRSPCFPHSCFQKFSRDCWLQFSKTNLL